MRTCMPVFAGMCVREAFTPIPNCILRMALFLWGANYRRHKGGGRYVCFVLDQRNPVPSHLPVISVGSLLLLMTFCHNSSLELLPKENFAFKKKKSTG